jgi:dihydrofolate reductase
MRKVNVLEFISLDGVIQAPGGPEEDTSGGFAYGGWTSPHRDPVSLTTLKKQMNMPFDLLLGRRTFDMWHDSGRNIVTCGQPSTQRPSTSPRIPWLLTNGSRPCF